MNKFRLDFIGIGAAKAGTTWLAECLREHPQVCMSNPKELNYFCTKHIWPPSPTFYDRGEKWLRARFSHWRPGQIRGEFSVSYLIDPESPMLIQKHFPDVKIVISYRNPTDSLYSFYYELAKRYSVPNTVEDFLEEYHDFIQYGFYHTHTKRYLGSFPLKNFHFIIFDDIRRDPEKVLVALFEFLGVDTDYRPPSLVERVNERKAPRYILIRNLIGNTTDFFRTDPKAKKVKRFSRLLGAHRVANWIQVKNLCAATFPSMREDTRSRLLGIYAEENTLLGELLNRDLSHWNR
jgi:hypothetical protein